MQNYQIRLCKPFCSLQVRRRMLQKLCKHDALRCQHRPSCFLPVIFWCARWNFVHSVWQNSYNNASMCVKMSKLKFWKKIGHNRLSHTTLMFMEKEIMRMKRTSAGSYMCKFLKKKWSYCMTFLLLPLKTSYLQM